MIRSRLCRVLVTAALVGAGSLTFGTGPAHALTVQQTCVGTEVTSYSPPVTFQPRSVTVTVSGIFTSCTDPEAFNGSYSNSYTTVASCLTLLDAGSGVGTIMWGNPDVEPSTVLFNVTVTAIAAQVIVTSNGIVTAGRYAQASTQQVVTLAAPDALQCLGRGVSYVAGPTTLTVFSP